MEVFDYNGDGEWGRVSLMDRYARYAREMKIARRDLSPYEHCDGARRWVYSVMERVIEGIEGGDRACVAIGIEFIEQDGRFPFGKILKSNTARALRRTELSEEQKARIRHRVFGMLRAGRVPREYREYAKLVRAIGYEAREVPDAPTDNPYAMRFRAYFLAAARQHG